MEYNNHSDNSEDISIVMANSTCVRFTTNFKWYAGSPLTQKNWDTIVKTQIEVAKSKDKHINSADTSTVNGLKEAKLVINSNTTPFYLTRSFCGFMYLIGLSLFYDLFLYSSTG